MAANGALNGLDLFLFAVVVFAVPRVLAWGYRRR